MDTYRKRGADRVIESERDYILSLTEKQKETKEEPK